MTRQRMIAIGSWGTLVVALLLTVGAATVGIAGIRDLASPGPSSGSGRVELIPGTDLLTLDHRPSWKAVAGNDLCPRIDRDAPRDDCENAILYRGSPRQEGSGILPDPDVRASFATLEGRVFLEGTTRWSPLIASIYGMQVLGLLVAAFLALQLGLLLRAAAGDEPFTDRVVRRLRLMGVVLVGWEVAEPVLWLVLSPKAWDYSWVSAGREGMNLQLGSMEPGGLELTRIAIGLLLLALGEVFRRGARLAEEQRLTV